MAVPLNISNYVSNSVGEQDGNKTQVYCLLSIIVLDTFIQNSGG